MWSGLTRDGTLPSMKIEIRLFQPIDSAAVVELWKDCNWLLLE